MLHDNSNKLHNSSCINLYSTLWLDDPYHYCTRACAVETPHGITRCGQLKCTICSTHDPYLAIKNKASLLFRHFRHLDSINTPRPWDFTIFVRTMTMIMITNDQTDYFTPRTCVWGNFIPLTKSAEKGRLRTLEANENVLCAVVTCSSLLRPWSNWVASAI